MEKILFDIASRSSPRSAMKLFALDPERGIVPRRMIMTATKETDEFLHHHRHIIESLIMCITAESPKQCTAVLPFCLSESLTTLELRSKSRLDCFSLQFLPKLKHVSLSAPSFERLDATRLIEQCLSCQLTTSSSLDIELPVVSHLETISIRANSIRVRGSFPVGIRSISIHGTCHSLPELPPGIQHLELCGSHIDTAMFPDSITHLTLDHTHLESGSIDLTSHQFDTLSVAGTFLDETDLSRVRAKTLDARWTSLSRHFIVPPDTTTAYLDFVPDITTSRSTSLEIHVGLKPHQISSHDAVERNADPHYRDLADQEPEIIVKRGHVSVLVYDAFIHVHDVVQLIGSTT